MPKEGSSGQTTPLNISMLTIGLNLFELKCDIYNGIKAKVASCNS